MTLRKLPDSDDAASTVVDASRSTEWTHCEGRRRDGRRGVGVDKRGATRHPVLPHVDVHDIGPSPLLAVSWVAFPATSTTDASRVCVARGFYFSNNSPRDCVTIVEHAHRGTVSIQLLTSCALYSTKSKMVGGGRKGRETQGAPSGNAWRSWPRAYDVVIQYAHSRYPSTLTAATPLYPRLTSAATHTLVCMLTGWCNGVDRCTG